MFRKKRQKYKKVGNHATIFQNCSTFAGKGSFYMRDVEVHSCPELMGLIQEVGFLPLLDSGIAGYSAEAIVDDECRYVVYSDGGWDWPLWKWKGPIVQEGDCVYGKFFAGKAGFVSREWWPDLCNWRRSKFPQPAEGSIEETILMTLAENGSLILTTPEALYGRDACQCERTPEESYQRIFDHLRQLLPEATERQIRKLI